MDPDEGAVLVKVALLHLVSFDFAAQKPAGIVERVSLILSPYFRYDVLCRESDAVELLRMAGNNNAQNDCTRYFQVNPLAQAQVDRRLDLGRDRPRDECGRCAGTALDRARAPGTTRATDK